MSRLRAALLLAPLLLAGCIPRYRVVTRDDPFFETASRSMRDNVVPGGAHDEITLDAEETRAAGDSAGYALVLRVRSTRDFLGIRPGESLILLIDSTRVALAAPSAPERDRSVLATTETARYPIAGEVLRRLGSARRVRLRVLGRRFYVERELSPANLRRFREFLPAPAARGS